MNADPWDFTRLVRFVLIVGAVLVVVAWFATCHDSLAPRTVAAPAALPVLFREGQVHFDGSLWLREVYGYPSEEIARRDVIDEAIEMTFEKPQRCEYAYVQDGKAGEFFLHCKGMGSRVIPVQELTRGDAR